MYKNKKISCVVLNYNDSEQTIDFLKSISNYNVIDNIIVVDNCSTDNSYSILSSFKSDKIDVLKTKKNGGYGYGNNFGVRIAKYDYNSDYVIISNPDVRFDEELIISLVDSLLKHKNSIVSSAVQVNGFTNKEISNCAWRVPTYGDYLRSSLLIINKFDRNKYKIDKTKKIQRVGCVPGAFLMVDSSKFLEIGGYDENIFLFCEESTLGYRVRNKGYSTILLTDKNYFHYHSTSIKKSIPQSIKVHRMTLSSRYLYLANYLKVGPLKLISARFIFFLSTLEYRLLYFIKRIKGIIHK